MGASILLRKERNSQKLLKASSKSGPATGRRSFQRQDQATTLLTKPVIVAASPINVAGFTERRLSIGPPPSGPPPSMTIEDEEEIKQFLQISSLDSIGPPPPGPPGPPSMTLETGAAVDTAKDACKTAETDMFTKATGKIAGDIKEGDVAKAREDAAVKAFMETNIATANAVVDGETYTDNQKQAAVKEGLKKVEGDKSTTEFEKTKLVSLKKKAGAKAIGDKAVACVMATASDAAALAACDDANLMDEAKLATGETIVTDVDVKKKDKRKAAKDLLKAKLNACGKFTVDADDLKVATFLKRGEKMFNDKKQAIAEIIRDKMKVELKLLADAKDGSVAEVTDEELDATLDV